jgi:hypothetical protein
LQLDIAAGGREVEGDGRLGVEFWEKLAGEHADTGAGVAHGDEAKLVAHFPVEAHGFGDGAAVMEAKAGGDGLAGGRDFDELGGIEVGEVVGLKEVIGPRNVFDG